MLADWPAHQASLQEQKQELAICRAAPRAIDSLEFPLGESKALSAELLGIRSRSLAHRGKLQEAAAAADKLASLELTDSRDLFYAAAGLALSADGMRAAQRQAKPTPDTKSLEERYAVRAVQLLKKAQAEGYFKDPVHRAALTGYQANPNLNLLLVSRDDYRKLISMVWGQSE